MFWLINICWHVKFYLFSNVPSVRSEVNYCKALNVGVPFISRISQAKQNREIKGRQYRYLIDNLDVDKLCLTHH